MRRRKTFVFAAVFATMAACADVVVDFPAPTTPVTADAAIDGATDAESLRFPDASSDGYAPPPPSFTWNDIAVNRLGTCAVMTPLNDAPLLACWPIATGTTEYSPVLNSFIVGAQDRFLLRNGNNQVLGFSGLDPTGSVARDIDGGSPTVRTMLATGPRDCVVNRSGGLSCWDDAGTPTDYSNTITNATFTAVAIGESHTCAIAQTGTGATANVYCWGQNEFGQTGQPASDTPITTPKALPLVPPVQSNQVMLASGANHGCALVTGQLFCWGKNDKGQSTVPVLDGALSLLALGDDTSCVVVKPGNQASHIHCFGAMNGDVPGIEDIVRLAVSDSHACAIGRSALRPNDPSAVFCWRNANGPVQQGNLPFSP